MTKETRIIYSPLQQTGQENGRSAEIHIYRSPGSPWILEVVDDHGNSTVWEEGFESDQQALETALREISAAGLAAFCDQPVQDGQMPGSASADKDSHDLSDLPEGLRALSEDELDELENFLLYEVDADEGMTFDMLDGFMHAIAMGPVTVHPQQWLPRVWGLEQDLMPPMESLDHLNRVLGLLMRHYNSIIGGLELDPPMVSPLWSIRTIGEQEAEDAEGWAYGFTEGVNLSRSAWKPLLESERGRKWYRPIGLLGEDDYGPEQDRLTATPEQRQELALQIPDALLAIHAHWLPLRQAMHEREMARQMGIKVGRNEPCPCGSGKKFKKCCGSASELH